MKIVQYSPTKHFKDQCFVHPASFWMDYGSLAPKPPHDYFYLYRHRKCDHFYTFSKLDCDNIKFNFKFNQNLSIFNLLRSVGI